ncbi:hypothetical protein KY339_03655 [Candidatus Woesearchaeota archaeon]|nr:hypothetical protein [Candidatus Woesearchaeota archaeon]
MGEQDEKNMKVLIMGYLEESLGKRKKPPAKPKGRKKPVECEITEAWEFSEETAEIKYEQFLTSDVAGVLPSTNYVVITKADFLGMRVSDTIFKLFKTKYSIDRVEKHKNMYFVTDVRALFANIALANPMLVAIDLDSDEDHRIKLFTRTMKNKYPDIKLWHICPLGEKSPQYQRLRQEYKSIGSDFFTSVDNIERLLDYAPIGSGKSK